MYVNSHKMMLPTPLEGTESDEERAHIYYQSVSILESNKGKLTYESMLSALGDILRQPALVSALHGDFQDAMEAQWQDVTHYVIQGWYNNEGQHLPGAHVIGHPERLLPLGDAVNPMANGMRRPINISFMRTKLTFNFDHLVSEQFRPMRHPVSFFVKLPLTETQVMNGAGNLQQWTTYAGPDDIRQLGAAAFKQQVLQATHQTKMGELVAPAFQAVDASLDCAIHDRTLEDIYELAWKHMLSRMWSSNTPSIKERPQAALEDLQQEHTDANGNLCRDSVQVYYFKLNQAMTAFVNRPEYDICVITHFVQGLSEDIRAEMESSGYRAHLQTLSRSRFNQNLELQRALEAATIAERRVNQMRNMVQRHSNQALLAVAASAGARTSTDSAGNVVLQSVAERTLTTHIKPMGGYQRGLCFGCCQAGCKWKDKDGNITCPRANNPGVKDRAAHNYKYYKQEMKDNAKKRRRTDYNRMSEGRKKQFANHLRRNPAAAADLLARLGPEATRSAQQPPSQFNGPESDRDSGSNLNLTVIPVLNAFTSERQPLPIATDRLLPHIQLALGPKNSNVLCPSIFAVADTGAALNTGDLDFWCALIEQYPEILKSATVAKADGYAPIVLSGVVRQDDSASVTTTQLPLLIEVYTPYMTVDGKTVSITIACGTGVAVNTLMGLTFMKGLRASLCFETNMMRTSALEISTGGFDLHYRVPTLDAPPRDGNRPRIPDRLRSVQVNIARIQSTFGKGGSMPAPTLQRPHELPDANGSGPTSILRSSKYSRREVGGYGRGRGRPSATRRDALWWYGPQSGDLHPVIDPVLPIEPPMINTALPTPRPAHRGAAQDSQPMDIVDVSVESDTGDLAVQAAALNLEQPDHGNVQAPARFAAVSPAPTLIAAPLSSDDEKTLFDHEGGYYIEEMDGEGEL